MSIQSSGSTLQKQFDGEMYKLNGQGFFITNTNFSFSNIVRITNTIWIVTLQRQITGVYGSRRL